MDGLEAVEMRLSQLYIDNETKRIDAEYFKKGFIYYLELIIKNKFMTLSDSNVRGGKRLPEGVNFVSDGGVPYIRAEDIKNTFIDYFNSPKIDENTYKILSKYQTKYNDVLITIVGNSIGDVGLVKFDLNRCNLTENAAKIMSIPNILPEFIFIFLLTKFGQSQINREKVGSAQPKLSLERIRRFKISELSSKLQLKIKDCVVFAHQKLEQSKQMYQEAEQLLLDELGLTNFKPSNENISIRRLSDSLGVSGRLDSEYYQPKYDKIVSRIKQTKYELLGNVVYIRKSIEPGSDVYCDGGIEFIRVSNVSKFGITKSDIYLPINLFSNSEYNHLKPKQDTILLSKDGSVGIAYKIKHEIDCITSGALLHLNIKHDYLDEILPEYLTLVLNSVLVQMQAERDAGGSIIQHWKPSEIEQILIPCIDKQYQRLIEDKIKHSFQLKEQSQQLLDLAKHAVEVAIEQDELTAMELIVDKMK